MLSRHLTQRNCCHNYCFVKVYRREINMLSDSEERCPGFFLKFSSVSVTDFHSVLRLQQVIALRHSIAFQRNLVHEQTTLSPILVALKKYTTCSFRFCTVLAFLKNAILQITRRVLDCKSGESELEYQKLASHVLFKNMA